MPGDRILVVDDEPHLRTLLCAILQSKGYETKVAESCGEAETEWLRSRPDLVILDHQLPDGNSIELLLKLKKRGDTTPVIVLTGNGSIELAVKAMQLGADHFVTKPAEVSSLLQTIENSIHRKRSKLHDAARPQAAVHTNLDPFLGTSVLIRKLAEMARRVAASDSPVLIQGETGTGKGVLARWLHNNGPRSSQPFVDLNCGTLSRDLLETELFGHEKGAFTGAVQHKTGLLEVANKGTVFLDEIGDVDTNVQPKLLKVLEDKTFRRLGDVRDRHVDIRLIAATHDLASLVAQKRFRADLYFRISTIPLCTPPLRQRPEDIPILAEEMVNQIGMEAGFHEVEISAGALMRLRAYGWPGNIRELRNVLARALLLGGSNVIKAEDLHFDPEGISSRSIETVKTLDEVERRHIEEVYFKNGGNADNTASELGISRSSLYQKIKDYRIRRPTMNSYQ